MDTFVDTKKFHCERCKLDLSGERESYSQHNESNRLKCKNCSQQFTEAFKEEHLGKYHPFICHVCLKRFTLNTNLVRHNKRVHFCVPCKL